MTELQKTESESTLTEFDWKRLEKLYKKRGTADIDWCVAMADYDDDNGNQTEIGAAFGYSRVTICQMATVGNAAKDGFFEGVRPADTLPNAWTILLELCQPSEITGKRMTKPQLHQCLTSTPLLENGHHAPVTKRGVREFKAGIGLLAPRPKDDVRPDGDVREYDEFLAKLKMVPAGEVGGLSRIGTTQLFKAYKKIKGAFNDLPKNVQRPVMGILVQACSVLNTIARSEANTVIAETLATRTADLDKRESRMAAQQLGLKNRLTDKNIKLIQSCLHPDKHGNVSKERLGQAFNEFRKAI